jgi:hypothetical protein
LVSDERVTWDLAPSTVCIWPFEQMYRPETENQGGGQIYNYDQRIAYAKGYFDQIEANRSLVFYYSNYSNPFSEDDSQRYVIVSVSRVKSVGKIQGRGGADQDQLHGVIRLPKGRKHVGDVPAGILRPPATKVIWSTVRLVVAASSGSCGHGSGLVAQGLR